MGTTFYYTYKCKDKEFLPTEEDHGGSSQKHPQTHGIAFQI